MSSLVFILALTGCINFRQDNIDIKTYMVETSREQDALEKSLASKLWIDTVNVLPPFNVRNLILRESDVEYSTSYYTELLMSPSENFRNELFVWIGESGLFEEVSIVERSGRSHHLVCSVIEFYGDRVENKAVLRLKATLLKDADRGNRVLLSKDYRQAISPNGTSVEELIRAYNTALSQILTELEEDLIVSLQ